MCHTYIKKSTEAIVADREIAADRAYVAAEAKALRRRSTVALGGLLLAMLLATLDFNIVAPALPTIVGELGGLESFAWVTTAYVLPGSVTTPLYGKLGDLYGRKPVFLFAILAFLAGSALSGVSHSMTQLVVFRVVQGVGGAGLILSVVTIFADLFSPEERPRYAGYFGVVFAAASVLGPPLGGFVADHVGWRWLFYLNLPIGAHALLITVAALKLPHDQGAPRIDYLGAVLLASLATCIVLLTTWGGTRHGWSSPTIVGLGVGTAVLLVTYIFVERFAAEPVIPLRLFRDRTFTISIVVTFISGVAMFGSVFFLPLFLQMVSGASVTGSGLLLLPLTVGVVVVSLGVGPFITRTGGYKWPGVASMGIATVGMSVLATMTADSDRLVSIVGGFLLGIGLGLVMQVFTLAAQHTAPPRDLGAATSTVTFARQVGGSFGVSIFGAIFNSRLGHELAASLPPGAADSLPEGVVEAYAHALSPVFLYAALILAIGFVAAFFLRQVPLREVAERW
jgi:EmrB/QacA subfamily drug resistance transporter